MILAFTHLTGEYSFQTVKSMRQDFSFSVDGRMVFEPKGEEVIER